MPSGVSYVLENRQAMSASSEALCRYQVRPVNHFVKIYWLPFGMPPRMGIPTRPW